jgi:hypothetical protein
VLLVILADKKKMVASLETAALPPDNTTGTANF